MKQITSTFNSSKTPPEIITEFQPLLQQRRGLILFSGANGSGRTTAMHMLAREFIRANEMRVVFVEDEHGLNEREIHQDGEKVMFWDNLPKVLVNNVRQYDGETVVFYPHIHYGNARFVYESNIHGSFVVGVIDCEHLEDARELYTDMACNDWIDDSMEADRANTIKQHHLTTIIHMEETGELDEPRKVMKILRLL